MNCLTEQVISDRAAAGSRPAVVLSAAMHGVAVAGAILFLGARAWAPPDQGSSFPIVFMAAPDVAPPAATSWPAAPLRLPEAVSSAEPLSAPHRVLVSRQNPVRLTAPVSPVAARPPQAVVPMVKAAVTSPAPAADSGIQFSAFEARVHQAVQQAAVYPPAARLQHRQGRARIVFEMKGSAVGDERVGQSSQSALLDRAALDAVRQAAMPLPPARLAARQTLSVWVDFTLVAED